MKKWEMGEKIKNLKWRMKKWEMGSGKWEMENEKMER